MYLWWNKWINLAYDSKNVSIIEQKLSYWLSVWKILKIFVRSMQQKCELNYFKALVLLTW